ncbi:MAG: RluA family pseudouridine synthase [Thermoanaerobaculum sp.]
MPEVGVTRYLAGPELAGLRLDQGLAQLSGLSRRRVKTLVAEGLVWVNGAACRVASRGLRLADVVDVLPSGDTLQPPPPPPSPLPVRFEDGWVVAVDKPPGMLTQPAPERLPGELSAVEHLALALSFREGHRVELKVVHRLDRVASGLLLFAKHHDAAAALSRLFVTRAVDKVYLAVVSGSPPAATTITAPILPDPLVPGRFRVAVGGKKAITQLRLLHRAGPLSVVEVRPLTGRTHQLRVHLASIGCPIAGDPLYGSPVDAPRPMLHAAKLALPHPRDGERLVLEAPLPLDFQAFCQARGLAIPESKATPAPLSSSGS